MKILGAKRTPQSRCLLLAGLLCAGLSNYSNTALAAPSYSALVASNSVFALKLYGQLAAVNGGNMFFSPYSISSCLGMAYDGAAGDTAQQMAQALCFSTNQAEVGDEFGSLLAALSAQQGQGGISLNIANGLWAQTNYPFLPAFLNNATTNFDAKVQEVDFVHQAPAVTDQINQWVSDQTQGLITNLFAPGKLNSGTVMALVNAIYFKGAWQQLFDTNLTSLQPFYAPGQTVSARLMSQLNNSATWYGDSILQAVELPYGNSNLVMLVLLPNSTNGLAQMEAALTPQELAAALGGRTQAGGVAISFPKFSLNMTADLIPPLKNLGMINAFSPGVADFSNLDGATDLSIQSITHKAVVDVDETGTVAAGATGTGIGISATTWPTIFCANHPFVFLICDTNSGSILFMGRVANPNVSGPSSKSASPHPQIQTADGTFGIRNHQFGFTVASSSPSLIVEACTNVTAGEWSPAGTITLTNGSGYFSEPVDPTAPVRFYRVRSQ